MSIFRRPRRNSVSTQRQETAAAPIAESEIVPSDPHLDEVLRRWTLVAKGNPEDVESRLEMVQVLKSLGHTAALETLIDDLEQRFPQVRRAQLAVARHYMNTERNELAIKHWLIIEEQYLDQYESTNNLAHLYLREKQFDQVLKLVDVLVEKQGAEEKVLKLRARVHQSTENWPEAIDCWQQILLLGHDDEAELQLITANLKSNEFSTATVLIEQALTREPGNDSLVSLQFSILVRQEKWLDALEVVDFLKTLRPDSDDVLYKQASVLYQLGRYEESDLVCEKLLSESPDDIRVLTLFARNGQARINQFNAGRIAVV